MDADSPFTEIDTLNSPVGSRDGIADADNELFGEEKCI